MSNKVDLITDAAVPAAHARLIRPTEIRAIDVEFRLH
jgi:uncharacterized protein Usg